MRDEGSGVRGQGSGVKGQGAEVRGQGSGVWGLGSGVRGQGSEVKGALSLNESGALAVSAPDVDSGWLSRAGPLSSQYGTCMTVPTRLCPWLSERSPYNLSGVPSSLE